MKAKLTNNIGLKLLAVLVAFALWLIVINYDDPVATATFSGIQVEIINESALTDQGKVYEVLNNSDIVTVRIEAKRSVLDTIQESNIRAVADMNYRTQMDTLAIQVYTNKNNDQIDSITANRTNMELLVEDLKTVHLPISVYTTGEPAEGFVVGDISQTQNTVRVSGPESVIEQIDRAECYVSVADRYSDISSTADIRLFDSDGVRVEHKNLTTNISSINVTVSILATKAVNLVYQISGEPTEGYAIYGEPTADRTAVYLAGRQNVLDGIYQIVIPGEDVDVSDHTESFIETLDLHRYLPDGTRLAQSEEEFDGIVHVSVQIVPLIERSFHIPIANLSTSGVPDGLRAEILLDAGEADLETQEDREVYLSVRTQGIQESYEDVEAEDIYGIVDVAAYMSGMGYTQLGDGIYQMEIRLVLPDGIEASEEYYTEVRISSETEEEEQGE